MPFRRIHGVIGRCIPVDRRHPHLYRGDERGAGYLAIAALIFGKWKILGTSFACLLFGAATAMRFQLPAMGVAVPNALLIMMPYLLALLAVAGLARISHTNRRIGAPNQRKVLCRNDFTQIRGAPRCRQSVARNHLILEP
jgi:ABC-type uncharacterized transport system permease subunit